MLILGQKSCLLGPTIFEIPQPKRYSDAGRWTNLGVPIVIGGNNLPCPGWNRVNWSAKYWGGPLAPPSRFRHHWGSLCFSALRGGWGGRMAGFEKGTCLDMYCNKVGFLYIIFSFTARFHSWLSIALRCFHCTLYVVLYVVIVVIV